MKIRLWLRWWCSGGNELLSCLLTGTDMDRTSSALTWQADHHRQSPLNNIVIPESALKPHSWLSVCLVSVCHLTPSNLRREGACPHLGRTHWSMCCPSSSKHCEAISHFLLFFYKHRMSITLRRRLSLAYRSDREEVRGEPLWERGGPVAWTCHRSDKLACNINKHTYISPGQYTREESTIPSTTPHWAWNNTTHAETTPQPGLSQHDAARAKLGATPFGEQAAPHNEGTGQCEGKQFIKCWHS